MIKQLTNTTASTIFISDTGVAIDPGQTYIIDAPTYTLWAASLDYQAFVTSGDLVVNNGTVDLSPTDGIRYIQYPDRLDVSLNSTIVNRVTTGIDFQGAVSVTSDNAGKAIVTIQNTTAMPCLREVTYVMLGGTIPMSVESNLLFEPDPINDTILFFKEEVL